MFEAISKWWCRVAHAQVYRPIRGRYRCAVCLREWPVTWQQQPSAEPARTAGVTDHVEPVSAA